MIYYFTYFFTKVLSFLYFPRRVFGHEHIPRQGGFIIASNHVSNLDPVVMGVSSRRRINFMAKAELFAPQRQPLGFFLTQLGSFSIKRGGTDTGAIKEAIRRLKGGNPVLIFVEGTRRIGNAKPTPQAGVGLIAVKAAVPVIPVFIDGTQNAMPPGSKFFKRRPVTVRFGPPVLYNASHSYQEIAQTILDAIDGIGVHATKPNQTKPSLFILSVVFFFYFFLIVSSHADLGKGLAGWWRLDESSGNAIDWSGLGNDGVLNGTTFVANCKRSGCRSFNGTSDYIRKTSFTSAGSSYPTTISAWYNPRTIAGGNHTLVAITSGGGTSLIWQVYVTSGYINSRQYSSGDDTNYATGNILGEWHLVTVVWPSANGGMYLYHDGVQVGFSATAGSASPSTNQVDIGASPWNMPAEDFDGLIDDVRVYNRALSAQEVHDLYIPGITLRNAVIRNARFNQ